MGRLFLDWICGIVVIYTFLFGVGKLIFGEILEAAAFLAAGCAAGVWIAIDLRKGTLAEKPAAIKE